MLKVPENEIWILHLKNQDPDKVLETYKLVCDNYIPEGDIFAGCKRGYYLRMGARHNRESCILHRCDSYYQGKTVSVFDDVDAFRLFLFTQGI